MKTIYYFEYGLVRLLDLALNFPPLNFSRFIGRCWGRLCKNIFSSRSKLARTNIRKSFPGFSEEKIDQILNSVWENVGQTAIEFANIGRFNTKKYRPLIQYEGREYVENQVQQGRGIIFIAMHLTNWEIAGGGTALWLKNVTAIARPIKNPLVEAWVQKKRKKLDLNIILHRQAVRESLRILNRNHHIAILPDQNLYKGGVFVSFFNRSAATTTLPALLRLRTGAPVILGYTIREGKNLKIIYEPPVSFPDMDNSDDAIKVYTQIISTQIENVVKKYPESWFWLHNRWKNQPVPEATSLA